MNNFEVKLVKLLNEFYSQNKINALAYRSKQTLYQLQYFDIIVDSAINMFYMAIECKNLEATHLYFSRFKGNQLKNLCFFESKTGRNCFLAVKRKKKISLIPWFKVIEINEKEKKIADIILDKYILNLKNDKWLYEYLCNINSI